MFPVSDPTLNARLAKLSATLPAESRAEFLDAMRALWEEAVYYGGDRARRLSKAVGQMEQEVRAEMDKGPVQFFPTRPFLEELRSQSPNAAKPPQEPAA